MSSSNTSCLSRWVAARIKIWDAGCASGEEPYTFLILLAEKLGKYSFKNVQLHATDIDISDQFGEMISQGIYPYEKLQRIPVDLFEKYFLKTGKDHETYRVVEELRSRIIFSREDLRTLQPTGTGFSLVICKNVLLHQTTEQRLKIINMFYESLLEGGFLVMEQTQKLPSEFSERFQPVVSNAQIFTEESDGKSTRNDMKISSTLKNI